MAATTMTAVAFAPSAAMAVSITLDGEISFGTINDLGIPSNLNNPTEYIFWTNPGTIGETDGDFATAIPPITSVILQTLKLTQTTSAGDVATYTVDESDPLTDFANFGSVTINGETDVLSFNVTGGQLTRTILRGINNSPVGINIGTHPTDIVEGIFKFKGQTVANGTFVLADFGNLGGGFVILTTQPPDGGEPIPEPLTMGGLAVGAGFGAFLKKRYAKKEKQLAKA
ncbi:PEP-CTERM sorting domain-containing protein [Nostoc sp. PCC 7524]|uniref:PEP-CTERM sorting domain-containing protein n=1 Tax=Nostoc sp. (strain ATCC 29411 / PCC 7524) TaxID=28072 RepID=UPI001493EBAF|nr:PEP-CTERM sorting domain-containing protein [Nostoc sp. PCC 7524]